MEESIRQAGLNMAFNNMYYTYILLKPGSDPQKLQSKLPAFIEKYAGKDLRSAGFFKKQFLINIRDIHFTSFVKGNVTPPSSMNYIYILGSIALFTLVIACINFMNLSTARSSRRSSE